MQFIQNNVFQIGKNKVESIFAVIWKHGAV